MLDRMRKVCQYKTTVSNGIFMFNHPETQAGEMFLLNVTPSQLPKTHEFDGYYAYRSDFHCLDYKSKRLGVNAIDINTGKSFPGAKPVFVSIEEHQNKLNK
jgi:hypothetical protein